MAVRYVTDADRKGWLSVVPDGVAPALAAADPTKRIGLPQFLKVDVYKTEGGREYFKMLEGPRKDTKASVKLEAPGKSFLAETANRGGPAEVRFNRKLQQLWFGGRGPFSAFTQGSQAMPRGTWSLEIPDSPHEAPQLYENYSVYYRTWFRVLESAKSDRYLHLGVISHGCVTARPWLTQAGDPRLQKYNDDELGLPIPAPADLDVPPIPWTDLYKYLIRSRQGDRSVGTIVVSDL